MFEAEMGEEEGDEVCKLEYENYDLRMMNQCKMIRFTTLNIVIKGYKCIL